MPFRDEPTEEPNQRDLPHEEHDRSLYAAGFFARLLLVFLFLASGPTFLRAQSIQIRVVDGQTGRPVMGGCVGVQTKGMRMSVFIPEKNGVVGLHLTPEDSGTRISYDPKLGCGGTGAIDPILKYGDTLTAFTTGDHPSCTFPRSMRNARYQGVDFSINAILQHGIISGNTCGKVAVSPQPGELILLVRPRTFHEKVKDWGNREAFPF